MTNIVPIPLANYRQIVVLTGAGISVASGLPTYRGAGGIWNHVSVDSHATAAAVQSDPERVWRFFAELRQQVAQAEPNAAHVAIAQAEQQLRADQHLTVLTQNVDGLHARAGSKRVVELHGSLNQACCTRCDFSSRQGFSAFSESCPRCPKCKAFQRPAVVLFDEPLPVDAEWAAKKVLRDCDLFLAVGTSGTVSPASNLVRAAQYAGARTVYVNLEPMKPHNPAFGEVVLGRAEELLPLLFGVG
ncbi:MAG TPA: NAD-dependent deacylase [Polyangiaceae bacterium]